MPHAGHGRSTVSGAHGTTTPRKLPRALAVAASVLLLVLAAPLLGRAAIPNDSKPGQRIDSRVLLLSADGTEPGFAAWKAELEREGVPYDAHVAYNGQAKLATLTDAELADYGANRAKYQAVILATGDLGRNLTNRNQTTSYLSALTDAEWATLDRFERTFGIRRLSDYTAPSPIHGLNVVGGASQDGRTGTLTDAGRKLFPYLKGPIPVPNDDAGTTFSEAFGYEATPVNPADWQTLVAAPTAGAAYLGIYTHPDDGREEMVMTVASNQFQTHNQALRQGMLTWVTRGVFLGYQRSYMGLDVDDIFLGDDRWDPNANVTIYDPEQAIRMTPQDVTNAVQWQKRTGLKLNMAYNMAGADPPPEGFGQDALFNAFRGAKNEFRWINHTFSHPNLDCTTELFTRNQLLQNQGRFNELIGPVAAGLNDPSEAITGEHSGLANVRPGNPGTIDPPIFDDLVATTGTLAAGQYDYALTATSPAGETVASVSTTEVLPVNSGVIATFNDVCHATGYKLYRSPVNADQWTLVGALSGLAPRDPVDNGSSPIVLSITDTGAAGTAATPPTSNGAGLAPYTQNPNYIPALTNAGIHTVASDSSKPYPNPPTKSPVSETDPTNFAKAASFPLSPTIRTVPRYPSNVYYNVANRAHQLDEYNWIYTSPPIGGCVPIANVTTCNAAEVDWAYYLNSETRIMFGHLMGNDPRPHYFHQTNIAQSDLTKPATDTTVGGTLYAVIDTLLARYEQVFDRGSMPLLQLTQQQVADTLTQQDAWAATLKSGQVSALMLDGALHVANNGTTPVDVPLTGTTEGGVYGGQRSGWVTIPAHTERSFRAPELQKSPPRPATTAPRGGKPQAKAKAKRARLKLTKVRMSPRRFPVAHKRKRLGTRLDGSTITWRLNKPATVTLKFQRRRGAGKWRKVGTIDRRARAGGNVVRFRGRFGSKLLKPGRYRVVVTAKHNNERSGPTRVRFRVVKG
jgi:hypothetical protein